MSKSLPENKSRVKLPIFRDITFSKIHKFFSCPTEKKTSPRTIFFFSLTIILAIFYGFLAMQKGFGSEYIIQDDARQHVFWMQRFLEPDLFPHDLIADYYQSVAPVGFTSLYKFMAWIGVLPLVFNKILPTILGVITAGYCFGVCLEILPIPSAAFMGSMLLTQNLWMQDTVISGKAASFLHPLLMAFLYYFMQKKVLAVVIIIGLFGLFYPVYILVCSALLIIQLFVWQEKKISLSRSKQDYILCFIGLGAAFIVLLPYVLKSSEFAPIVTAAEARILPEFQLGGRASFFNDSDPWKFWFHGSRTGIRLTSAFLPPFIVGGLLLPILLKFPQRFKLTKLVTPKVKVLLQLTISSLILFFLAHALLFKLYIPSRYTQHTLRFVMTIAAGIVIILLLDKLFKWAKQIELRQIIVVSLILFLVVTPYFYSSFTSHFPNTGYLTGEVPKIYQFFATQPKDILIASIDVEANFIPSFSKRSILVGSEYGIPYHLGYYRQIRQRASDLITAQYSLEYGQVKEFIDTYGIDFWLLRKSAFTPDYLAQDSWIRQYQPATKNAIETLKTGKIPIIAKLMNSCSVMDSQDLVVLSTGCIVKEVYERST